MKEHDEIEFLKLLEPYESEDAKRSRRILVFISFIIFFVWFLELPVEDIRILGLPTPSTNPDRLIIVGWIVLIYWMISATLFTVRDILLFSETKHLAEQHYRVAFRFRREVLSRHGNDGDKAIERDHTGRFSKASQIVKAWEKQQKRTTAIRGLNSFLDIISKSVPIGCGIFASAILWGAV